MTKPYTAVYVVGSTEQLGFQSDKPYISSPKLCCYNILIKQIVCGDNHTHILSQDGFLYSFGQN